MCECVTLCESISIDFPLLSICFQTTNILEFTKHWTKYLRFCANQNFQTLFRLLQLPLLGLVVGIIIITYSPLHFDCSKTTKISKIFSKGDLTFMIRLQEVYRFVSALAPSNFIWTDQEEYIIKTAEVMFPSYHH